MMYCNFAHFCACNICKILNKSANVLFFMNCCINCEAHNKLPVSFCFQSVFMLLRTHCNTSMGNVNACMIENCINVNCIDEQDVEVSRSRRQCPLTLLFCSIMHRLTCAISNDEEKRKHI